MKEGVKEGDENKKKVGHERRKKKQGSKTSSKERKIKGINKEQKHIWTVSLGCGND